jgi:hypothetical protein
MCYITLSTLRKLFEPNLKFNGTSLNISWRSLWDKGKGIPGLKYAPRHEDVLAEWRYSSTHSLTSVLYGDEWSDSRPGRFTLRERAPGNHWIGGWMGPRAAPDALVKRKIPSPLRDHSW